MNQANSLKYRMYIDEVGNSDLNASTDPNHRYLSLTGVAVIGICGCEIGRAHV